RTLAIALAKHPVGSAEIASPRAAARGLDGEPVVGTAAEQIVARDRKLADIDGWKIARVEDAIRFIVFSGAHDRGPDVFAFADDRVIAVLQRFFGANGYMQPAHRDFHARGAQTIGDRVRLE